MTQIKFPLKASLYLNTWKNKKLVKNDLGTFLSFYVRATQRLENRGDPATSSLLGRGVKNFQPNLKMGETQIMLG